MFKDSSELYDTDEDPEWTPVENHLPPDEGMLL